MRARITSAEHVWAYKRDDRILRVRVDYFPDPSDPLYDSCHVQVPERPLTKEEQEWVNAAATPEERQTRLDAILATIPKVWRVNPINCHFHYLQLGFTAGDLFDAIYARIAELKGYMGERAAAGKADISAKDMPDSLKRSPLVKKGTGPAMIATAESKWTPTLVAQAGTFLNGTEINDE